MERSAGEMAIGDEEETGMSPVDDVTGLNDDVIQSSRQLFCRCSGGGNWNILESCSFDNPCGEVVPAEAGGELTGVDMGKWGDPAIWKERLHYNLYALESGYFFV